MLNFALYTAGQDLGGAFSPERLALAGQMTLIGMGLIFAVLSLLWAVLGLFRFFFAKPVAKKPESAPAPVSAPEPVVEPEPVAESNDDELIAVITAAVAAYISENEPDAYQGGFRVVSFRRTNGGKAWNAK